MLPTRPCPRPGARRLRSLLPALLTAALLLALVASAPPRAPAQEPANPMREMMRQMMRGAIPPPGLTPEALPLPGSDAARLLVRYCTQCHDLPSPRYKTYPQWPDVFERMAARMRMLEGRSMMGGAPLLAPSLAEARTLLAYLVRESLRPARPAELEAGDPADRAAFRQRCAECHALPSPALHEAALWPAVVSRMRANAALMGRPAPGDEEAAAIGRFLRAATAP